MSRLFERVNARAPGWVQRQPREMRRFIKFAIVGGIGALVDFAVLNVLVLSFGVPKAYANIVSVSTAIVSNFIWNRLWTFPESRNDPLHTQFGQFALVNLIGLGINELVFLATDTYILEPILGPRTLTFNLAKGFAIFVVLFWNFGVNRFWTWRHIK